MDFDPDQQRATLSIKAFASFDPIPSPVHGPSMAWRAGVGQRWHQDLRTEAVSRDPAHRFEVPVAATIQHLGWTLQLNGRIDQLKPSPDGWILREIKTVGHALPASEASLREAYPEHFLQLISYLVLVQHDPEFQSETVCGGELVLVDYRDGVIQVIHPREDPRTAFLAQADRLVSFLESQRTRRVRLRRLQFPPAFDTFRPEQEALLETLNDAFRAGGSHTLQAPTGFGKTGITLQAALEQLREGNGQRAIFLTGKSTGQLEVIRQLQAFARDLQDGPRFLQLRSHQEHLDRCPLPGCDGRPYCQAITQAARQGPRPDLSRILLDHHTLPIEGARRLAADLNLCPFEITKACLPAAEIWVCDYNYVFSMRHAGLLENTLSHSPGETLLIVDEAHNLPARVADNHSFYAHHQQADYVLSQLRTLGAKRPLLAVWDQWVGYLEHLRSSEVHPTQVTYEVRDHLNQLVQALEGAPLPWDRLPPLALESLQEPRWQLASLADPRCSHLLWSKQPGELRVTCLDAAGAIAQRLQTFRAALLMSATLEPIDHFCGQLGLDSSNLNNLRAAAPWREGAYEVAIDARVDTRLRRRADYYLTTANTVVRLVQQDAPLAVFFPSYQYAETIQAYLQAESPITRVALQPRATDPNGQMRFLEEALLSAHALFFVLGSSFSESIDLLGGRVSTAMVVGPALPEVNPIQRARMERTGADREEAFRQTYLIPAMQKINQALGRLVRAPGQKARILLHCRRFREPTYLACLDPDCQPNHTLRTDEDFEIWLRY